jgi:hypothetical protein
VQNSRQELYKNFLDFIRLETQRERLVVNRRMLNVFFWCFLLPAVSSLLVLLLVKLGVLPPRFRIHLDWLVLVFPVAYSIYFLSREVLVEIPEAFKRGGIATSLGGCLKEGEWRDRVAEGMRRTVSSQPEDWLWITESFRMDLQAMRYRARYLTVLAGAVFFLLMQGIDSLTDDGSSRHVWMGNKLAEFLDAAVSIADLSQFVGLALFLVLLYLSGSQNAHSLERYLNCAELLGLEVGVATRKREAEAAEKV